MRIRTPTPGSRPATTRRACSPRSADTRRQNSATRRSWTRRAVASTDEPPRPDSATGEGLQGVLMQLGRAYMKAGKKNEAAHAFTRVVEEFPQSVYAADARKEMEEAKKG